MAKLLVDANIYLQFYDQSSSKSRQRLRLLLERKADLFVTRQVVDEVQRNKVRIAARSLAQLRERLKGTPALPNHMGTVAEKWNKRSQLLSEFDEQARGLLGQIAASTDEVSVALADVFAGAVQATPAQTKRAWQHKELGRPPGKKEDPLGDQLTWLQLLDSYDGEESVWIVTKDTDLYSSYGKAHFLNAALYDDLKAKSHEGEVKVRVYETLADALRDMAGSVESGEEFQRIRADEVRVTDQVETELTGPSAPFGGVFILTGQDQLNVANIRRVSTGRSLKIRYPLRISGEELDERDEGDGEDKDKG
jgi:hypothetical protein